MLKKVIADYADGFRWSRVKEMYNFSTAWIYIYMLTLFPILINIDEAVEKIVWYYLGVLPVLLGLFSMTSIPLCLPKQMFLCPLTIRERKRYIAELFMVRFLVPTLTGAVSGLVLLCMGFGTLRQVGFYLLGLFSYMFCGSITTWPGSVWNQADNGMKRIKNPAYKGLRVISGIGMVSGIIGVFLQLDIWNSGTRGYSTAGWIAILIFSAIQIIFDLLMLRYIDPLLEMGISYEDTYVALKKAGK